MSQNNLYQVLGVSESASQDEIKKAYRKKQLSLILTKVVMKKNSKKLPELMMFWGTKIKDDNMIVKEITHLDKADLIHLKNFFNNKDSIHHEEEMLQIK